MDKFSQVKFFVQHANVTLGCTCDHWIMSTARRTEEGDPVIAHQFKTSPCQYVLYIGGTLIGRFYAKER